MVERVDKVDRGAKGTDPVLLGLLQAEIGAHRHSSQRPGPDKVHRASVGEQPPPPRPVG